MLVINKMLRCMRVKIVWLMARSTAHMYDVLSFVA